MSTIDSITNAIPEAAKDIRLNLQAVLSAAEPLNEVQRQACALAVAYAVRDRELAAAIAAGAAPATIADAQAAAALMAMNNVYYRTRHMLGGAYEQKAPRLRMNRLAQPATDPGTAELAALAVSAVNGCQVCVQAHEASVRKHGLGDEHVHQALRIAAVVAATAVAHRLEAP